MAVNAAARFAEKDRRQLVEVFCISSGDAVCIVFAIRSGITNAGRAPFKQRLSGKSEIPCYSWRRRDVNPESRLGYA